MKTPSIAACMIVKNEEKTLPVCLRSIQGHVDEIVVVDTGSTDATVSVAESFGARVYHHPWEDHFSKHRNQSLSYSRCEWNLVIDADEELCPADPELLRNTLSACGEMDAVAVMVECPFGESGAAGVHNSVRILRSHRGILYRGRVHNYLVGVTKVLCTPIRILHHGYVMDRETQLRRFRRTTALLRKDIEEDPQNPRPHHFLAVSYLTEHMNREAAMEAEEAVRLFETGRMELHNYLWSLYVASSARLEMGDLEKANELATRGLDTHEDHLDSHYLLALISFHCGKHRDFLAHMERYLEIRNRIEKDPFHFGEMVHNSYASEWVLHLCAACLSVREGREEEARRSFENAGSLAKDSCAVHSMYGKLLLRSGRYLQASEELAKAVELKPGDKDLLWTLSYAYHRQGRTLEQISCIERIMKLDPRYPNGAFQLGLCYMILGRYETARESFLEAQALDPENRLARINEALCLRGMGEFEKSLDLSGGRDPGTEDEHQTLLLNRACCHDAIGNEEKAVALFLELQERAPKSLDPPVYLSRLFLKTGEIERCVAQCDRLLKLLGFQGAITLESLSELGALYAQTAASLSSGSRRDDLSAVCSEIARLLGCPGKSTSSAAA